MKSLHLLRHAKSSWDEPGLADHRRGLNTRGRRDAPRMGRALSDRLAPVAVDVSTARRAQLTLEGLFQGWPELEDLPHRSDEDLYTFSEEDILYWLAQQDDSDERRFLIGHNPAFTELVNLLCGGCVLDNLPTAGYAELEINVDRWRDLTHGEARLQYTLFPKQLKET